MKLVEPLLVVREYPYKWKRPTIDRSELAKLRNIEGWTRKKLAQHFGCSESRVSQILAKLPRKA